MTAPIYIADAALYLMRDAARAGDHRSLRADEEQFDAAIELLKQQNENIGEYWSDYTKEMQAFANGDRAIGTTWPYQACCSRARASRSRQRGPRGGSDRMVGHVDAEL